MTQTTFKLRFWRVFRWFLYLFVLLFVLRFGYGFLYADAQYADNGRNDFFSSITQLRRNYASEKYKAVDTRGAANNIPDANANPSSDSEEKYEKTATIGATSPVFDKDEQALRTTTTRFNAVVQYEQSLGNKGHREVHLLIGVLPEKFDSFYLAMQKFGTIQDISVTKVDKTNEYRQLNAKKVSLEKTLVSLNELKTSGKGDISELIALHDKILDIETQLQELGVSLGNFNANNEFCTVRFSLYEGIKRQQITVAQRLKVALEWTIKYYAVLVATFGILCIVIFFLLLIADKLKLIQQTMKKIQE